MTAYKRDDFEMMETCQNRIRKSLDYYAGQEIPDYTLWHILLRFDNALGDKEKRYAVMRWMFPGKWSDGETVTGNDLTPLELHVMARWSDNLAPGRRGKFEEEVNAVYRILSADIDTPVADHILSPAEGYDEVVGNMVDENLSYEEQKQVFRDRIGIGKYPMRCGHMNDDYTISGHPICNDCLMNAETNQLANDARTIDRLKLVEGL